MDSNIEFSNMESTDMDLDISWIKENQRLQNMETNYLPELMENIDLFFIYINPNNYIDKIIREKYPLFIDCSTNCSRLSKENLLKIIQTNKRLLKSNTIHKYKFMDILTYHIDLEPEHIQNYTKNENIQESSQGFFKVLNIIDDISISPSIFIFHKINSIFFLFQEIETNKNRHTLKSILKKPLVNEPECVGSQKATKKVRIDLDKNNIEYREHSHNHKKPLNKTRKNIRIMNTIDSSSIVFISP